MTNVANRAETDAQEWQICPHCRALLYHRRLVRELKVCHECGAHTRLTAVERLDQLADDGKWTGFGDLSGVVEDPLSFDDVRPYRQRIADARASTGLDDAAICATTTIGGRPVVVVSMDFRFLGGSMGAALGELISQAGRCALATRTPLLMISASGGARIQEGAVALMQMAKAAFTLAELNDAKIMTVSLITDPTYGGVAASFVPLADVVLAEPGARMGFAGPRVIEQTIRQVLPEGFQTAEFLLEHGLIDAIVPRASLRSVLKALLGCAAPGVGMPPRPDPTIREPDSLPQRDAWNSVNLARNRERPTAREYISYLLDDFQELKGDRLGGDCPAIVGGIGRLHGEPVMVIGNQRGRTLSESMSRNFGMPNPEGYRKAARLMRLAAKLGLPVITLIDTPGAYPGIEAEQRGQALAIAANLELMARLPVPIVAVVIGEGGSGGALALGVADRVLACSNAVYSVISPEGGAAILWQDSAMAPAAAAALQADAGAMLRHRVLDGVLPEPVGGAHLDHVSAAAVLSDSLAAALRELCRLDVLLLLADRRARFERIGLEERR